MGFDTNRLWDSPSGDSQNASWGISRKLPVGVVCATSPVGVSVDVWIPANPAGSAGICRHFGKIPVLERPTTTTADCFGLRRDGCALEAEGPFAGCVPRRVGVAGVGFLDAQAEHPRSLVKRACRDPMTRRFGLHAIL